MDTFKTNLRTYLIANDNRLPKHKLEYRIKDMTYVGVAKDFCEYISKDIDGEEHVLEGISVELPYMDNTTMVFPIFDTTICLPINLLKEN